MLSKEETLSGVPRFDMAHEAVLVQEAGVKCTDHANLSASEIRGVPNRFAYAKLTMMVPARGARTRSRDYMQETYAGPVRQRTFSLYLYAHGHLWCLCEYGQQARCLCEYGQHTCLSCGCVRCYFAELLFVPPFTAAPREVLLTRHERALRHERAPAGRVQPRDGRGWDDGHRVL